MITLSDRDARWLLSVHFDQLHAGTLNGETYALAQQFLTRGSTIAAASTDAAITAPCHCNQPDTARDHVHQRGDRRLCRDVIEGATR
jgi:hypothetical protein